MAVDIPMWLFIFKASSSPRQLLLFYSDSFAFELIPLQFSGFERAVPQPINHSHFLSLNRQQKFRILKQFFGRKFGFPMNLLFVGSNSNR